MQFTLVWIVTAECIQFLLERLKHHLPVVLPTNICPYICKLKCKTWEAAFHFCISRISDHIVRRLPPSGIEKNLRAVVFSNSSDKTTWFWWYIPFCPSHYPKRHWSAGLQAPLLPGHNLFRASAFIWDPLPEGTARHAGRKSCSLWGLQVDWKMYPSPSPPPQVFFWSFRLLWGLFKGRFILSKYHPQNL